jgi:hypothetical protein
MSVDRLIVDDIIFYYVEKKRLWVKNYNYIPLPKCDKYFEEAALLCDKHRFTPAMYVQKMYDRLGDKKHFFTPEHMRGGSVEKMLESDQASQDDKYTIEITNNTLDPADVWRYQHELAMRYINRGESVDSVLMDSSLKLFAWYRILSTPERVPSIINKYKHIAKKEMTPRLLEFLKAEGLDIERILS